MKITFASNNNRLTGEGYLSTLYEELSSTDIKKPANALTTSELMQIPTFFASVPPDFNIATWDSDVTSANGHTLTAKDFRSLVAIMYLFPRGKYWKAASHEKAYTCTQVSGAVPFPMLGFKRFQNIPYSHFMPKKELSIEECFKLDCLLGNAYASTGFDNEGVVNWSQKAGLAKLCMEYTTDLKSGWPEMTVGMIRWLRTEGFGKRQGNPQAGYGANMVQSKLSDPFVVLYNDSNVYIKHLLTQRWLYYYMHRNDDMICDVRDWDNIPGSADSTTAKMNELDPVVNTKAAFGL